MRSRQPRGGQCVRFVGMHHIDLARAHQAADGSRGIEAPPTGRDAMRGDSCFLCALGQQGITYGDELGSVAAGLQAAQEKKALVLATTEVAAQIDDERAHRQASPGLGQERRVSFSPAHSRPSLRYLA